jgi:hypothetical protein
MITPSHDDRSPERKALDEQIASEPHIPWPTFPPGTTPKPVGSGRVSITSDCITSVGYQWPTHVLEIEFTNGSVYQYFNVPSTVYRRLLCAESHGTFFNEEIKDAYEYQERNGARS